EITEYAYESLSEVEHLTVYGPPPSRRAGVISFSLEGIHPHDLATIADRDQVCLRAGHHCAMPLMTRLGIPAPARASFYVYTQKGLAVEDAKKINKDDVLGELGIDISPARIKCALLSLKVLKVGAYGLADDDEE